MRRIMRGGRARAALLAMVLAAALPGAARGQDVGPVREAIAELRRFPTAVESVTSHIQASSFGPFHLGGSCDYSCFIGICFKTYNWSWSPDFSWLKDDLGRRYTYVSDVSRQFDGSFAPVRSWLVGTLPQFSAQLDAAAVRMQTAEGVIIDPASSPEAKAAARGEIERSIAEVLGLLERSTTDLRGGVSSMSGYNQRLTEALRNVENSRAGMEHMLSQAQGVLDPFASGMPCDDGAARGGYDAIKNAVRGQFDGVLRAAEQAGVTAGRSDHAVSLILGSVLNVQNQYQGVLQKLRAAEISPPGAVQQLRLNVATAAWRDLAAYAQQQFGNVAAT
jgi:hypothetical protein